MAGRQYFERRSTLGRRETSFHYAFIRRCSLTEWAKTGSPLETSWRSHRSDLSPTEQDGALQKLRRVITNGWTRELADVEAEVKPYFSYRDELTTQDGIILRGDRIVIPTSMRKEVKQKAHAGHMAINACIRRARDLVFWPGLSKEIRQLVESCKTCARHANKQQPETLHMHPVPDRPWAKVGTDLFTISGRDYLVTVDYFSNFYEIDFLADTLLETIIGKLKNHFARHGIPDTCCITHFTITTCSCLSHSQPAPVFHTHHLHLSTFTHRASIKLLSTVMFCEFLIVHSKHFHACVSVI